MKAFQSYIHRNFKTNVNIFFSIRIQSVVFEGLKFSVVNFIIFMHTKIWLIC
jgi:hypothetical protein